VAVLAGIGAGALIGLFNGFMRAKVGVPSFIVTLAGFIGFSGALLYTLGDTGSVNLNDAFLINLVNLLLPVWLGWVIGVGVVAAHALIVFVSRARRRASGLRPEPLLLDVLRVGVLAAGVLVGVAVMNTDRGRVLPIEGVPLGVVIFLGLVAVFQVITRRTSFGRHLYAVGGNEEAARRAGINVVRVRLAVFVLASSLAAFGGILAASRGYSVNQSSGGGDVLLNAIAAAVIGGTSLFGGRGSVITALLGSLVIGSIANGMDLLALQSSVKFMITGGVLLAAVTVDAVARRGRMSAGRVA
jgi:D-xylose transport system permease protein